MDDKLWQQHLAATFPASCRGSDIDGIDLVMADADTAGCLQTYFTDHKLAPTHIAILGRCYHDLGIVQRRLSGDAQTHFQRLEVLAGMALESLSAARADA